MLLNLQEVPVGHMRFQCCDTVENLHCHIIVLSQVP
uniref:Uncharacterized protein n=1 Tax=Anguilla anguilla TaxID=7936 RepID=A0A0E9SPP7_ANGAN